MTGKTHIIGGIAIGTLYSLNMNLGIKETILTVGLTTIGSLLPDLDKAESKLGRKLPILSIPLSKILGHRTLLHYPIFYLALGYAALEFYGGYSMLIYPLLMGIFSHLFLDFLNPMGIPLITPKGKKFNLLSIYTGSISEGILATLIVVATTVYVTKTYYL